MTQPDMNALIEQAQRVQNELQKAQQEITATTVTGSAGNDLVKIIMDGAGRIHEVAIDPKVVDPDDVETLQDLIVGAYNDAHLKISALAEEKMGPLSQSFGNDGLSGLFG